MRGDLDDIDAVFGALSHETRRQVLQVLAAFDGTLTSGALCARFAHSWPTVSRHLHVLRDAGLVEIETIGRARHYRLARQRLAHVLGLWLNSVNLQLVPAKSPAP